MEKLILTCGRFSPLRGGSTEARVAAMEAYLAKLGEEMEFLVAELGRAASASAAVTAAASAAAESSEGGEVA